MWYQHIPTTIGVNLESFRGIIWATHAYEHLRKSPALPTYLKSVSRKLNKTAILYVTIILEKWNKVNLITIS